MTKTTVLAAIVAALSVMFAADAWGQSTATPVVTGYLTTSGCPTGQTACFVQYGAAGPVGGTVTVTNLPATVDTNTGAAGANTLRVVQATGSTVTLGAGSAVAGKFGIDQTTPGTTNGVQLTSGSTTAVTQATASNLNATVVGTGTFAVQAAQSGNWTARIVGNSGATLDATVAAATAPTNGLATLCVYNSIPISLTNGQSGAVQCDANANAAALLVGQSNTTGVNATNNVIMPCNRGNLTNCVPWAVSNALMDGSNQETQLSTKAMDSNATAGIAASGQVVEQDTANTITSVVAKGVVSDYQVSATNTAVTLCGGTVCDLRNVHDTLAIDMTASAGTCTVVVSGSPDNTHFLTIDSLAAAASTVKQYTAATVGATAAVSPLSFRYVKVTIGACGAGDTSTTYLSAK